MADTTSGQGNAAQQDEQLAQQAEESQGAEQGGGQEEGSLLDGAPERKEKRADDLEEVGLAAGSMYSVTEEDLAAPDPWTQIARDHGMSPDKLQAFNQHVEEVDLGLGAELRDLPLAPLEAGIDIYIPSAEELVFSQCRARAADFDAAVELYGTLAAGPNVKMMTAARARASGVVGQGYGTKGVDSGKFYTPNPEVAGASSKRSSEIGGQTEYQVFWVADFWKCSIFMHDTVWQAGYQPGLTENKHYLTAGKLGDHKGMSEVDAKSAAPGDCFQRFGGRGSDESHNTVLSSFVEITELGEGRQLWAFDYVGAETERAAEAHKEYVVDATGKVLSGGSAGNELHFFRPTAER